MQVVLAYLMATERISMESALASVRHVYPYASPNEGKNTYKTAFVADCDHCCQPFLDIAQYHMFT